VLTIQDPANNFLEYTSDGEVSDQGALSIDVNTGDQFYLAMGLMAGAGGIESMAESLSTLEASFVGAPSLAPSINAVPLPPAFFLFGSALLGMVGIARRKKAA